uniref:Uncharacterized protein n=1 Tax=Hordeum vulgare subsp. vulgare TaxID=112509 RepID=A0A8I7B0N9_HORVV
MYQDDVIKLLINEKKNKNGVFSDTELIDLQNQIANCTMKFDEDNLFKVTPNIVKFLINKEQPNAKQYLKGCLPSSLPMLKMFGIYTLEAIMIHVLGLVFNTLQESSAVKAARFIDQLNSTVREQARFLQYKAPGSGKVEAVLTSKVESVKDVVQPKGASKKEKKKKIQCHYDIGKYLLQFMIERNVLHISTDRGVTKEDPVLVLKKGQGYIENSCYVMCNLNINLLPIKLNLPMLCKPLDWQPAERGSDPDTLSDLIGGYLCKPTGDI